MIRESNIGSFECKNFQNQGLPLSFYLIFQPCETHPERNSNNIQKEFHPIVDRVGQFGLVQGTCPCVLNIYENVNVNCFMQNINVSPLPKQ